jgi:hypothetical protein
MFVDKFYEELDDISKMIEPFNYEVNDALEKVPDRIDVTRFITCSSDYGRTNEIRSLLHRAISEDGIVPNVTDLTSRSEVIRLFKFEFEYDSSIDGSITINGANDVISGGKIFLVKRQSVIDDQSLELMVRDKFLQETRHGNRNICQSRVSEVCGIYGANTGSIRSPSKKYSILTNHIYNMIKDKKLNIKDVNLSQKLGKWISMYIRDGNLGALQNLTKVKIMTHSGRAIYSIEEKEV